jgi:hypothetical protein
VSEPHVEPPADASSRRAEPLDVDGVRTATVGTVVWAVAFVVLLPFSGRLADDGHTWWLWTCAVGAALGLLAIRITSRRRDRLASRPPSG